MPKRDRKVVSAIIVQKDADEKVTFEDIGRTPRRGAVEGVVLGGVVGLLIGGAGLTLGALGGVVGHHSGKKKQAIKEMPDPLGKVAGSLGPNSSAIIAVVKGKPKAKSFAIVREMGGDIFEATILQEASDQLDEQADAAYATLLAALVEKTGDEAHVASVHVDGLDSVGGKESGHRNQDAGREQPTTGAQRTPVAHAPGCAGQCQEAQKEVDPPDAIDVHAQAETERVEQVREQDVELDAGEIGAGTGLAHDGEIGVDAHGQAGHRQQRGGDQHPSPVALGRAGQQQAHVNRQQEDGEIVAGQEEGQRRHIAHQPAAMNGRAIQRPPEQIGAEQCQPGPEHVGPRLLSVPEEEWAERCQNRRHQGRGLGCDLTPGKAAGKGPGCGDHQCRRGHGNPAQDELTVPGQPDQAAGEQEVEKGVLVRGRLGGDAIPQEQLAPQQRTQAFLGPLQGQALVPPEIARFQRPQQAGERGQDQRQQQPAGPALYLTARSVVDIHCNPVSTSERLALDASIVYR